MAYRLFTKDRRFAEACHNDCIGKKPLVEPGESKVALFTDTHHETNGVALTIRMQLEAARKNDKNLSVITCHPNEDPEGAVNSNLLVIMNCRNTRNSSCIIRRF